MKKIFYLFAMMLPLSFTSCDNDDDLPDVNISVDITNAPIIDGQVYVVRGDTLAIDGITCTNNEQGKNAAVTEANYYFDYYYLGTNPISPYGFNIVTTPETRIGNHILEIECPVVAVDKTPATALVVLNVTVVESAEDIPSGAVTHQYVSTPSYADTTN